MKTARNDLIEKKPIWRREVGQVIRLIPRGEIEISEFSRLKGEKILISFTQNFISALDLVLLDTIQLWKDLKGIISISLLCMYSFALFSYLVQVIIFFLVPNAPYSSKTQQIILVKSVPVEESFVLLITLILCFRINNNSFFIKFGFPELAQTI